ncbi:MAG TPA: protein prkA [Limnochordia bacterium]|nr:protein prkA [Limnochordia bacterium]
MALADWLDDLHHAEPWKGDFAAYFERVLAEPKIVRTAHQYLLEAIRAPGVTKDESDRRNFDLFAKTIFGLDDVLDEFVGVMEAAARGLDIRRRIVLLVGPPGSAKSTIVTLLKRALENYSQTDDGRLYAIAGCPMHEEPLHLLPPSSRERLFQEKGIRIEGELCPVCRWRLQNEWERNVAAVPVEQIVLSEAGRVGIASFAPGDPNLQDTSDLTGSMDLVALQKYGTESHPMAYRFDGALNVASRGLFEGIELLKAREELLFTLITLAQERQIKVGRFALIDVDEVLLAHTNEAEYQRFATNRTNEALQSRTFVIQVPYNLKWDAEIKIYEKLFAESQLKSHLAPWSLKAASAWALLSRFEKLEKYDALTKLHLYNGEFEGEYNERHAEEARELSPRDGLDGVSPRQVINALSQAVAAENHTCLNPIDALRALRDSADHHVGSLDAERLDAHVTTVRRLYDDWAIKTVNRAFIASFEGSAQELLQKYLDNAEASLSRDKVRDPVTGEWIEPDDKFLKGLEDTIGIPDSGRKAFREELLIRVAGLSRRGAEFRWDSHPRLKDAIEKKLFADLQGTVRTTVSTKLPDEEQKKRIDVVTQRLIESEGFCESCAPALLEYVGYLLNR